MFVLFGSVFFLDSSCTSLHLSCLSTAVLHSAARAAEDQKKTCLYVGTSKLAEACRFKETS